MDKELSNIMAQAKLVGLTEEDLERCFNDLEKGHSNEFGKLSFEGRELLRTLLQKTAAGDTAMLEDVYSIDYEHRRVDPHTFLTHPDYMGHFQEYIYPAWIPHLMHACDPAKSVWEVVLTGALGIGKSTIGTGWILSYHLHRLLCLKEPAAFYGLAKGSKIVFGVYSLDLKSAEDIGFYILRDQMLADSPFFNTLYRRAAHGKDEIILPKNIVVKTGSQSLHAAGKNLFSIAIDEMNLMKKGATTAGKAFTLATSVSRRLESRFMQVGGEIPGVTIFIGSAGSDTDFIEKRIKKIRHSKHHYVVRGARWEYVHKGKSKYSGKTFRVQIGNKYYSSKLLDEVIEEEGAVQVVRECAADEGCDVIDIPVEHYTAFYVDTDGALKDFAGVSTQSFMKLFSNHERIQSAMQESKPKVFKQEVIAAYLFGATELAHEFQVYEACCVRGSRYRPLRNPMAPRYIHVDLAKRNDRAGIAMVHPSTHFITVDENDVEYSGIGIYDIKKELEVDFALGVECGPKREVIDFAKIRRLIFQLRRYGYWIRVVTMDTWQSEDTQQRLTEAGLKTEYLSVDQTCRPYLVFRNAVNAGKVKMAKYTLLYEELVSLDYDVDEERVDHPEEGSKDIADAVAGACYRCLTDKIRPSEVPPEMRTEEDRRLKGYLDRMKDYAVLIGASNAKNA